MTVTGPPALPGLTHVRTLGSGGYSDVYLYEQQMPRRQVAVKVLHVVDLDDALRTRFTTEANTMAGLAGHPNIVPVFSADIAADGRPYLTMMFYPRANLAERAEAARFPVAEVLRIGVQIGSAIETAHRANILHRDIKPANILTNQFGVPGLADFGIAGELAAGEDDPELGVSIHYCPPEILYSTASPSVVSDVYSFGATLWTLLVGRPPFSVPGHDTTPELMERIRNVPARPTARTDVPESLDRVLLQALAKNPAVRPRSALDFARGLQRIEQELQLAATPIVVETPEGDTASRPASGGGETRIQAAKITGQPPRTSSSSSAWAPSSAPVMPPVIRHPPTRSPVTTGAGATVAPETVHRATVVPPVGERVRDFGRAERPTPPTVQRARAVEAIHEPEATPRGVRRWIVVALVGVLAVAAVVTGIVVAGGGSSPTPTSARTTAGVDAAADQDGGGADLPPGPVMVTAAATAAGAYHYTWTYSAQQASDTYVWQTVDAAQTGTAKAPELDLTVPAGASACVQVKVVRADGSNAALQWSSAGCP